MSILNEFSKVYEIIINDIMVPIIQTFLSNFVSAYRKHYSAKHVQIMVYWKKNLGNNKIADAAFIDLLKAFNCIPDDFLVAKRKAYGVSENFLSFFLITPEASTTICKH